MPRQGSKLLRQTHKTIIKHIIREIPFTMQKIQECQKRQSLDQTNRNSFFRTTLQKIIRTDKVEDSFKSNQSSRFKTLKKTFHKQGYSQSSVSSPNQTMMQNLRNRIQKLRNKISLDQQHQSSLKTKLQEIIQINQKQPESLRDSHEISCFKSKHSQSAHSVINKYWKQLQIKKTIPRQSQDKIKKQRIKALITQNTQCQDDNKQLQEIQLLIKKKYLNGKKYDKLRYGEDCSISKQSFYNNAKNNASNFKTTLKQSKQKNFVSTFYHSRKNSSRFLEPICNQFFQDKLIQFLTSKKQHKQLVKRMINKDKVKQQDAKQLYGFFRGGYPLDSSDLQGEFISLARFNQAKNQFVNLGQVYKDIRQSSAVNEAIVKAPVIYQPDSTFMSLVCLNELKGKVSNQKMKELMKIGKVVK